MRALLAAFMNPPPDEAAFNAWYDEEHVPLRLAVPGFLNGRRYRAHDGAEQLAKYLALYDLTDTEVMKSDAFRQVRETPTDWTKKMRPLFRNTAIGVYRQIFSHGTRPAKDADFVLTVRLNTPAEKENEFKEWYNVDHVPALVGVPGVYCARRYVAVEGDPKYLAVYEMNDARVPKTPEWDKARNSEWTLKIRPHLKDGRVIISRRIYP